MKKKITFVALISLITFTITGCNQSDSLKEKDNYYNYDYPSSSVKEEKKEITKSDRMIIKILELMDEKLAFDTGNYIKGEIPAGEYAFIKFNGSGSYYCEKDSAGNIIDNENFDSFGYVKVHSIGNLETNGILINIAAFEKLHVKGAKEIYEILNEQSNWNQGGNYKVGVDIDPGRYVVESIGSGYWAILTGPVGSNEIIDNDNFNGKSSINLTNGQYLELSRATISKIE